jgi:putative Holliday junction resolvase
MKKVAIDFGTKRTGFAFTDPNEMIVSKVKTVDTEDIFNELEENQPFSEIIIGLPINLKMNFTPSTYLAVDKAIEIGKLFSPVPVYLIDERFTTKIAGSMHKKEIIDGISASILLEERLRGAKGTRVFWSLPNISTQIVDLISSIGPFKDVLILGNALRGIEKYPIGSNVEIFEDNPVFFRLRSMSSNYTLNFGMIWDIILKKIEHSNLVICEGLHREKIKNCFSDDAFIITENANVEGTLSVGGRCLKIEKINKR